MSANYLVYKLIKSFVEELTDVEDCTYNDYEENKPNVIGVAVSGNEVSSYRTLKGSYSHGIANVLLLYNMDITKEGILTGEANLEKIRDKLVKIHNKYFKFKNSEIVNNDNYDEYLQIAQIDLISDLVFLRKNQFKIPQYSIRFKVNYTKGGK